MDDLVDALLLVDVQRAFVAGQGAVPAADQLVGSLSTMLDKARAAGVPVIQLQNDGPHGAVDEPGQPGWELHFPARGHDREIVIRKTKDDGFDGTPLAEVLRVHGIQRLAVGGVMSEMCVLSTARTALARGLGVVLPHDGHATYDIGPAPGSHDTVPAALASRVAEWALGDEVEIVAHSVDIRFAEPCRTGEVRDQPSG